MGKRKVGVQKERHGFVKHRKTKGELVCHALDQQRRQNIICVIAINSLLNIMQEKMVPFFGKL
jgi:hypothetical protein